MEGTIRIAAWPDDSDLNPYFRYFYRALQPHGIELGGPFRPDDAWLRQHRQGLDAVHFHFPELAWQWRGFGPAAKLRGVAGLWRLLRLARRSRLLVIWTYHDLKFDLELDRGWRWIDRLGYLLLMRAADLVVSHSRAAAADLCRRFPVRPEKFVIVYHGSLAAEYADSEAPQRVRRELGLRPDRPALACLGSMRRYKGYELAFEALRRLPEAQLLLAGKCEAGPDWLDPRSIEAAERDLGPRLVTRLRPLASREQGGFLRAVDGLLLPYRSITTSGLLMAALGVGTPVVAFAHPFFREVLEPEPAAAVLVARFDAAGLAEGIEELLARDREAVRAAALRLSERYAWKSTVLPFAERLRELRSG